MLMRPTGEVKDIVSSITNQIGKDQKLLGVHFRSQFAFGHHACGCKDLTEIAKCAGNMGSFLTKKGMSGWNSSKVRIFVASDQKNGILAFDRAFGEQNIMKLPNRLPIEHSLSCSKEGGVRAYADLLILSQADALLGSCGSTFTAAANLISGRSSAKLSVTTGSREGMQCASMADKSLDLSGFIPANFVGATQLHACDCYAPGDPREGACMHQCTRTPRPSKCATMRLSDISSASDKAPNEEVPWHPMKHFI